MKKRSNKKREEYQNQIYNNLTSHQLQEIRETIEDYNRTHKTL